MAKSEMKCTERHKESHMFNLRDRLNRGLARKQFHGYYEGKCNKRHVIRVCEEEFQLLNNEKNHTFDTER